MGFEKDPFKYAASHRLTLQYASVLSPILHWGDSVEEKLILTLGQNEQVITNMGGIIQGRCYSLPQRLRSWRRKGKEIEEYFNAEHFFFSLHKRHPHIHVNLEFEKT